MAAVGAAPHGLRRTYLASLAEPQELYVEQLVTAGRVSSLSIGNDLIGDVIASDDTIVEFYVVDSAVAMMPALTRFDGRDSGAVQDL